ncbi:acyl-CoA dehydrogenase domain-containing protein, partial [Aquisalimonas sp.]|uniref:acyl-CoA dehydrogenase domain-containing protein n=1 Tax=Aquisalimonas sp. TaxID=1872621 RepID=UPI0025C5AD5A
PTEQPGVEIGRRHIPSATMFQNGPTSGTDVFIPLENIIGGADYAGRGWMMLMKALAAGRGISLPSLACAASALAAHSTGAYARVRQQFNRPIGKFGGIQEPMARLAGNAYAVDSARRLTCAGLDEGRSLAVISALMKYSATERMRRAVNDAMDVHAGKTVIDGPSNYLSPLYKALPIGITVEGANIVTRSLMIFGQGAVRAHPHMLDEVLALQEGNQDSALESFDKHFWAHVGHSVRTFFRALARGWTGAMFAPAPNSGKARPLYRSLGRWASAYALTADMALLTMGGGLKGKEMISGRMSDILCELYFLSAILKRWEDDGRKVEDYPLVEYNAAQAFSRISTSLDEVLANFPSRWAAGLVRLATRPGGRVRGPDDHLTELCANLIYEPSATRERLIGRIAHTGHPGLARLNEAYQKVVQVEPLATRLRELEQTATQALEAGVLTEAEKARLDAAQTAVDRVIAVDDYSPAELAQLFPGLKAGDEMPKEEPTR